MIINCVTGKDYCVANYLASHGVMAGIVAPSCWSSRAGDLSSLDCLCGVIFRMPPCLEPLDT